MSERNHRSEAEWQSLIFEHSQSGQSALDFCRERGLYAKTFYRQRKALRNKGLVPAPATTPFVRLRTEPVQRQPTAPGLELQFQGSRLQLPADTDPSWLAMLMRKLA